MQTRHSRHFRMVSRMLSRMLIMMAQIRDRMTKVGLMMALHTGARENMTSLRGLLQKMVCVVCAERTSTELLSSTCAQYAISGLDLAATHYYALKGVDKSRRVNLT